MYAATRRRRGLTFGNKENQSIIAAFIPSFLCLVSVQNYINAVTEKRNPSQRHYGWSSGHIVCLVFGIIVWATLLLGLAAEL